MDDDYKYLFNSNRNASSVSNYSYGSTNNTYRDSQYSVRKKTSIYPNYIPDNSYATLRNEESSFTSSYYPHATNYHYSAESNYNTKKNQIHTIGNNYSSSVQTTSNKSKPSIYQNPIQVIDDDKFFVGSSSTFSKADSSKDARKDKTNNVNPIQYVDDKYLANPRLNSHQKDLNQNAKKLKIYNQNPVQLAADDKFFVGSSSTFGKADSSKDAKKDKNNNVNPIQYVDDRYLANSHQKDLNQNAKKPKIYNQNPMQLADDDKFFVESSLTSSKTDSNKNENPIQYVDEKYLFNSRLNSRQKDLDQNVRKPKTNNQNPIQIIDDEKFLVSFSSTSSKADSNKNSKKDKSNNENPIQYVDDRYLTNPRHKNLNQNAKKPKINNQNPIQIIDDDNFLVSSSSTSSKADSNKNSKKDKSNNENPIQYVDDKYLANPRLNSRQKDLNQNVKKLKINNQNPIQIIDDDNFLVSSSSTSSKAESNKNTTKSQINNENPIQYVDDRYLANSRLNSHQKDLNQNVKKLKINNQNPIQIIDDDRLYSNLFSTSRDSNLKNENKESKTDLFHNAVDHFNDGAIPREELTSNDFESQATMKTNRNIGELILVGKSTFHYLGRSGDCILALDSNGTIHYIPNNIHII